MRDKNGIKDMYLEGHAHEMGKEQSRIKVEIYIIIIGCEGRRN